MTPQEAVDHVAALCDKYATDAHPGRLIAEVRATLTDVWPGPGVTLTTVEAAQAATCVHMVLEGAVSDPYSAADLTALAARLEGCS